MFFRLHSKVAYVPVQARINENILGDEREGWEFIEKSWPTWLAY